MSFFDFNQDQGNEEEIYRSPGLAKISKAFKMISSKIKKLRQKFLKYNIDGYIVPKNDKYFNEYSFPDRLKLYLILMDQQELAVILLKKLSICRWKVYNTSQVPIWKNFSIIEIHKKLP